MQKMHTERIHAKRRAMQRYGISINRQEYKNLCMMIQGNEATFVVRQSDRVTIWRMTYREREFIAVYDKKRHNVVTFLPSELTNEEIVERVKQQQEKEDEG